MTKAIDYAGRRYGRLTAIRFHSRQARKTMWVFACDCGGELVARMDHVAGGATTSCGCLIHEWSGEDHFGKRYGRLVGIERVADRSGKPAWRFECDYGESTVALLHHVVSGATRSCGCFSAQRRPVINRTHGHTAGRKNTGTYNTYRGLFPRCDNPEAPGYPDYGGRGITICDRWRESFENFLSDMGPRPPGKTLDRINNDGNYEPLNCRWATPLQQSANRRPRSRVPGSLRYRADAAGVSYSVVWKVSAAGLTGDDAIAEARRRQALKVQKSSARSS